MASNIPKILQYLSLQFNSLLYRTSIKNSTSFSNPFGDLKKHVHFIQLRFKSYKKNLDLSKVPTLNENDLKEQFVRGSGPGGQSTNKTSNCIVLKHKPTGIVVKCHETRSQLQNQKIAREIMTTKLDNLLNGENSVEYQKKMLMEKSSLERKRRQKKMLELKKSFKEREGLT
ncbi:probable peptide chain release factor C12orf65 homolog, mitochondrial [Belonocnema kinseyi]|uniref:probable peptide chain release factor C12orf65 homolog, mitochondrial n=1 Tax=Belonocnema kinseyi TaxID=2817044 RepID=UPI00143DF507|nr:probable peptide chain release factor C12orf65 homolog, mitochondrial [Belonocnema kinseyi]